MPDRTATPRPASRIASIIQIAPIPVTSAVRNIKAHANMALRSQMMDLIGLELIDQFHQTDGIGEVSVVKGVSPCDVRILLQMDDAIRVKGARAPDNPGTVPLLQQ
jgi:hypothetical protein